MLQQREAGVADAGVPTASDKLSLLSRRYDVSEDAVQTLLRALERGGGNQAQFSHPDLGGMGQWSSGGMIMVGDMFDAGLKARVNALCTNLSDFMRKGELAAFSARGDTADQGNWWPGDCGTPSSSGSQNDMRYAYFPSTGRLAIQRNGKVTLYKTGDHRIAGVSQQQSGSQDLSFASQHGTIRLHDLTPIDAPTKARIAPTSPRVGGFANQQEREFARGEPGSLSEDDAFGKIERLHELHRKGIVDDEEFADKKRELLARI